MTDQPLSEAELDALRALDTPTVCNALEIVAPERRAIGFTTTPLVCPRPELPPSVGYARTARLRSMRPAQSGIVDRVAYYDYVAEAPGPTISIIEDIDTQPGYGAFWGEVNTNIHKAIGCLGVVSDSQRPAKRFTKVIHQHIVIPDPLRFLAVEDAVENTEHF